MIKYSFVIPTYNNKNNLINSLECVFKQDAHSPAYEVIVVDDGSSDGLGDGIGDYIGRNNFQYIRLERDALSSRSRARNTGWKKASGEFIVFIDSDILINTNYLIQLDRYFEKTSKAIVIGNRLHIKDAVTKDQIQRENIFNRYVFVKENFRDIDYRYLVYSSQSFNANTMQDAWLHAYSCNLAVKKARLVDSGGFDENILDWGIEDIELAYRLTKGGAEVLINPYLEVLHQNADHRDDLAIGDHRMKKYLENVNYFLGKHPSSMNAYKDPVAQLVVGKDYREITGLRPVIAHYGDILETKKLLEEKLNKSDDQVVVYDFTENSGLDLWVQTIPDSSSVLYFPMSKKIDVRKMMTFINAERAKNNVSTMATEVVSNRIEKFMELNLTDPVMS